MTTESQTDERPLCVDLDGTLVETDTMYFLIASFLRAQFWRSGMLLIWLAKGRAHFKKRLAEEAVLRVDRLPVHLEFFAFLQAQRAAGRRLVLASAADERTVRLVAARFDLFEQLVGSDGKTNLRGAAKTRRLTELFGVKGFDYAGNSSVDLPVWEGSAHALVVNAEPGLVERARLVADVSQVFPRRTTRWKLFRQILRA